MKMYKGIVLLCSVFIVGALSAAAQEPRIMEKTAVSTESSVAQQSESMQPTIPSSEASEAMPVAEAPVSTASDAQAVSATGILTEGQPASTGAAVSEVVAPSTEQPAAEPMVTTAQAQQTAELVEPKAIPTKYESASRMVEVSNRLNQPFFIKLGDASAAWERVEPKSKRELSCSNGSIWVSLSSKDQDKNAQELLRKNTQEMPTSIKASKRLLRRSKEVSLMYGWNFFKRESFALNDAQ